MKKFFALTMLVLSCSYMRAITIGHVQNVSQGLATVIDYGPTEGQVWVHKGSGISLTPEEDANLMISRRLLEFPINPELPEIVRQ